MKILKIPYNLDFIIYLNEYIYNKINKHFFISTIFESKRKIIEANMNVNPYLKLTEKIQIDLLLLTANIDMISLIKELGINTDFLLKIILFKNLVISNNTLFKVNLTINKMKREGMKKIDLLNDNHNQSSVNVNKNKILNSPFCLLLSKYKTCLFDLVCFCKGSKK